MPTTTLKSPLVALAPLALFFLVTATVVLQHTGAITSSAVPCLAKISTCTDETECYDCMHDWVADGGEAWAECLENFEHDQFDICSAASITPCCYDFVSSHDCMGNDAFVDYWLCSAQELYGHAGGGECTVFTCNHGDGEPADDEAVVIGDDTGAVDDVADDDAGVADADAGGADDDPAGAIEDSGATGDDADSRDVGLADDNAGIASDTGRASRVGSSSTSIAFTAVRGLTFFTALTLFLAASL